MVYCRNKYTARMCGFKGYPEKQGPTVSGAGKNIAELTTASDEQRDIFHYCEHGKR
jgi:hypothetical protein